MAVTTSTVFQGDIGRYIVPEILRLAHRQIVLRQFAQKMKIPEHEGLTLTATRFNRLALPFAPLNEGVAPDAQTPTISQVTGVALQWGARVVITDVSNLTIKHPVSQNVIRLQGYQVAETYERNHFNQLNAASQINYVNSRGSRAALVAGDVLDPTTVNRTVRNLKALGAPMMNGPSETDVEVDIESGPRKASGNPKSHEHYVQVSHPIPLNDFAENATVQLAWSYSDINMLYMNEAGQWRGMHFCESNMVPSWTGVAQVNGANGVGSLTTASYYIQLTGSDPVNQYETLVYQVSAAVSVTTGGVTFTTPATPGDYTFSAYIGTTTSPQNLGLSSSGPTTGPYAGMAVQLPPNTSVTITGIGLMQIPPAAPATGLTVYRSYVFGEDYFAALELEKLEWFRLEKADKSDQLNQLRSYGWKGWDGILILNQLFGAAIESVASSSAAFG